MKALNADTTTQWTAFQPSRQMIRPLSGAEGRRYHLALSLPRTPAPAEGFPSILVLDGGRHFQAVAAAAGALGGRPEKTGVEPLAVIGLFHDEAHEATEDARARDFTGSPCPEPDWARPFGEAATFRWFLSEAVLPAASEAAPLNPECRALFGHSLGGLFVLETLEAEPDLFSRWISMSPSLWWTTPGNTHAGEALLIGYGENETARNMRGRIEDWAEAAGRGVRLLMAARADHGSTPLALLPDALRHASYWQDF